ncbi:MAG TPA: Maf family protein [Methyloradius sp.]
MNKKIYLASRSPRRAEILSQLGVSFEVLPADIDESVLAFESPDAYVIRLAEEKALACLNYVKDQALPVLPILAADTTVALQDDVSGNWRILGKPEHAQDAFAMLKSMSGQSHYVHTAIAVVTSQGTFSRLSSTQVEFSDLTDAEISAYVDSGEPMDKAGAYGIQGFASTFIKRIDGSYSGVMGLPIFETSQLLKQAGIDLL